MKTMDRMYRRQTRELSQETKDKISASLKGRSKSYSHKQNISQGLVDYWKTVPSAKDSDENEADGIF